MNKEYFQKVLEEEQEIRRDKFYLFMKNEGFTETIGKNLNFADDMPLFYKRIGENKFLVFNIPYYGKVKGRFFQADFWRVKVNNEDAFLKKKIDKNLYDDIILGFRMERNLELYYKEIGREV
ncbi:hypothetical protein [Chryseobacterium lathyri]|jgi:hypothetical protein|uniref:Uncharacterized protein n=1 Tax=Chryseobacterium lathyri TaxID=395933 RepID=A0A511YG65_9FLAO|nr:hypothetical protein [Chryseobacterium lathyri]GEN74156.1 hypothetical protein CLA01_42280 [Chryseobacterium lathyri]